MEWILEYFLKHRIVIFRSVGAFMVVVGFAAHFWVSPKEGLSENEMALANLARIEAQAKGTSSSSATKAQDDSSKFLETLKNTQARQMEYLTILTMLFGVGFLGYSFIKKDEES